tara:strand:+ start:73 stop:438 length:366 start_codon:yes stop_codon:yes gene_type:complete
MSNGRGTKDKNKKILEFAREVKSSGRLNTDDLKAAENELDSYNKFVEKVADSINLSPSGLGKRPPQIFTNVLKNPPPQRFKRPTKKPVFKTGTKEKIKGLTQDMAGGGEVINMSTEMVIDE